MTYEERKERSEEHLAEPQAGDAWWEMSTPRLLVLGYHPWSLRIIAVRALIFKDSWRWDLMNATHFSKVELRKFMSYPRSNDLVAQVQPCTNLLDPAVIRWWENAWQNIEWWKERWITTGPLEGN